MHILNFAICGVFGVKSSEGAFLVMKKKIMTFQDTVKPKVFPVLGLKTE